MLLEDVKAHPTEDAVVIPPVLRMNLLALANVFFGIFLIGVFAAHYTEFPLGSVCLSLVAGLWARACYELLVNSRASIKQANAAKCKPVTVAASRS